MESSAAVREEYDRLAEDYDRRWSRYVEETLRAVLDSVRFRGDERVLDVACGTGELQRRLLERWPALSLVGCDLSEGMLRQASAKDSGGRVTWINSDAARIPFVDESFDAVICANSFHYFRAPGECLREGRRVLRSVGRLILVDWCDDYVSCKVCSAWLRWTDPAIHRTYSLRECRSLLTSAGFEIEEAHRFRVGWIWGMMRLVGRPGVGKDYRA